MKNRKYLFLKYGRLRNTKVINLKGSFKKVVEWVHRKRYLLQKEKLERELFHSCVILKNLTIVQNEMPMSADYMLEQLMESSQQLRYIYADMLTVYRNGNHEEAFQLLCLRLPSKTAQSFSRILCKWDYMPPTELLLQMEAFQETFSAERKTKAMARAERKSMVTTMASTVVIFVILLNFTVVVIFLDTLRILNQLF